MVGTHGKEMGAWGPWVNVKAWGKASGTIRKKDQEEV